jgi:hypothetical protein
MATARFRSLVAFLLLVFAVAVVLPAQDQPANDGDNFTEQQQEEFLLKAKVIRNTHTGKGVTDPYKLTLSDGTVTHNALFQSVDEMKPQMQFADGRTEFNFKDSYKYDIAGYQLAKLLGLDNMIPVAVERDWHGMRGSMVWWVPNIAMDEGERTEKNIAAPDPDAWNNQMYKVRVFDTLIYDTDANLTNVLITKDWKIWRIDFTRAFRTWKKLKDPKDLVMCDKDLFAKLKALNQDEVKEATKKYLSGSEIKAVMARRDLIVEQFNKMIAEKGEAAVLY